MTITNGSRLFRGRRALTTMAALTVLPMSLVTPHASASTHGAVGTALTPASSAAATSAKKTGLNLGNANLPESRRARPLAPGVTLTSIVRGQKAATEGTRGTTPLGPWRVNIATIDPRRAKGQLRTAIGTDIARTEGVSTLGRWSKSYVAVNGSFFSQGRKTAPGDMVGVAVNGGTIVSQPQRVAGHVGVLMDSRTKRLRMDNYAWTSTLSGHGEAVTLDAVNTPLTPPAGCESTTDASQCAARGSMVRFTPHYSAQTPVGPGAEVVLDRKGCVVSARPMRGSKITPAQTAIQATGQRAGELLRVAGEGCPTYREKLIGSDGKVAPLTSTTFGVVGRYQLVKDGAIVAPNHRGDFFGRQPRTFIGHTAGGSVMLVTVDGRSTASVGVTLQEEARLAASLGLVNAVNLDGGGSTAMAVSGKLVNRPVGGKERSVGDAVVFMR